MKNPHIIVGPGNMCLCGTYNGESISCHRLILTIERIENREYDGKFNANDDARTLCRVLRPLIKDMDVSPQVFFPKDTGQKQTRPEGMIPPPTTPTTNPLREKLADAEKLNTIMIADYQSALTKCERYEKVVEMFKTKLTKMAGHRLMQIAQPARELLNVMKALNPPQKEGE